MDGNILFISFSSWIHSLFFLISNGILLKKRVMSCSWLWAWNSLSNYKVSWTKLRESLKSVKESLLVKPHAWDHANSVRNNKDSNSASFIATSSKVQLFRSFHTIQRLKCYDISLMRHLCVSKIPYSKTKLDILIPKCGNQKKERPPRELQ